MVPESNQRLAAALIEAGADVNAMDENGETPLHLATDAGEASLVALLLEAGADVNACEEYGRSLVHLAVCNGEQSVLKVLLEAGADIDALEAMTNIEDLDLEDVIWLTPLHSAVGLPEIVSLLLKAGADASIRDSKGRLAWDIAREYGEYDDDFLYSDGYWLLHKATAVATRSHGRLDDGPEDYLDEDPEETSEVLLPYLEPVAVPASATPPAEPRRPREKPPSEGWGWLLTAIVSLFLVLFSWTIKDD